MYCPKIAPDFVESASCTVPISTCTCPKFTLICQKTCLDFNSISNCPFRNNSNIVLHVPVVSSFLILFKTYVSSQSIGYVHLDRHELFTLYRPKVSPDFVELASCTVPITACSYPKFNLLCQKNILCCPKNSPVFV